MEIALLQMVHKPIEYEALKVYHNTWRIETVFQRCFIPLHQITKIVTLTGNHYIC